jgi:hypothetical protein
MQPYQDNLQTLLPHARSRTRGLDQDHRPTQMRLLLLQLAAVVVPFTL